MRKELKKVLIDNPTSSKVENFFKSFNLKIRRESINFILKQKTSIEEKIYNLIEGIM